MRKNDKHDIFDRLYREYHDSLMIIALSYTHDRQEAEDLVHEAYLKALLSYDTERSFLHWAKTVIKHDFLNRQKKRQKLADTPPEELSLADQCDILAEFIQKEEKRELVAMISLLPIKYRDIMMDYVYLGLSDGVIAAKYGTSEVNIRKIRSRAKEMLLKQKEERDGKYEK